MVKQKDNKLGKDDSKPKSSSDANSSGLSKPSYANYPDYTFLQMLDKDGDEKISRAEFENWAQEYAMALKKQSDQQAKLLKAQQKLQKSTNVKERHKLEVELKRETQALQRNTQLLQALDKHIQQHMKAKQQQAKHKH